MKNNTSALVIVAHPDDETIWMGGTIANFPHIKWTIFTLCRKNDLDRAPKFKKVCRHLKAAPMMSDLEDEGIMGIPESVPEIEKRILKKFADKKYTYLFTHGSNGEYGHPRHQGVHRAVQRLVQNKKIKCQSLMFFAYRLNKQKRIINIPEKSADIIFRLNSARLKGKKNIIKNLYGFGQKSFENVSCLPTETFTIYH